MLNRDHAARGKAAAIPDAVDIVEDRHRGIAWAQEIAMRGMSGTAVDRAIGGDERLADHLSAEDALPADLRAHAAIQVLFERLDVEDGEKLVEGAAHGALYQFWPSEAEREGRPIRCRVPISLAGRGRERGSGLTPEPRKSMAEKSNHDVIIAGGGFVGMTLALALGALAPKGFRVALVDAEPPDSDKTDARASALSAASKGLLSVLGIWPELAGNAQPITSIEITDSSLDAALRPALLGFDDDLGLGESGAYMIENADLHARALACHGV